MVRPIRGLGRPIRGLDRSIRGLRRPIRGLAPVQGPVHAGTVGQDSGAAIGGGAGDGGLGVLEDGGRLPSCEQAWHAKQHLRRHPGGGGALMGYGVDVKGYCVDIKGYGVDGKFYGVDVKRYGVDVKGYGVDVKGYGVDVKGYVADFKRGTWSAPSWRPRCTSIITFL
eukprot:8128724-Pyramimonas_sp.AAC.1